MDELEQQIHDAYAPVQALTPEQDTALRSTVRRANTAPPRRWLGVAAAAVLIVAGGVYLVAGHGEPTHLRTGDAPPEVATTTVTRGPSGAMTQLLVLSGSNPKDNQTLVRAFVAIVASAGFRQELSTGTGVPADQFEVTACSPAGSAIVNATAWHPDPATAMRLAKNLAPTLHLIIDADQRNLPAELRIPGPIVQELGDHPIAIDHASGASCDTTTADSPTK
jgi:hypothetical protein